MADIPTPRSYEQILGDAIDSFCAKQGLANLRVGNPILSFLEAASQSDFRSSQDTFNLLNAIALDKATGLALDRIGNDEKVPRLRATPATDSVTIGDSSFTKKATTLFQGLPAPIAGTTTLSVVDASLLSSTGSVYIGRGTLNYEGPLAYSSKTNAGTHWNLALTTPTAKFHNNTESVILAQGGNRVVSSGQIVKTSQANLAEAIEFRTFYASTIPDGEVIVTGVLVQAQKPGSIGNVPAGSINQFATDPFVGATVTNPTPFSNGVPTELDDDYRERIRNKRKSRAKGIPIAITTEVTGLTAPDENKRITSASLVKRLGRPSTVYIDDGTGYEEKTAGIAVESLVDSAVGGEEYFEVRKKPIAKAFVTTKNSAPYALTAGGLLAVKVGGVTYVHNFDESQFNSISNATAYEVVASINSNETLGFIARTSGSGSNVVIFGKNEVNEDVEVFEADGNDANDVLGFPSSTNYTIQLYKNDILLNKDGKTAVVQGEFFHLWDAVFGSQTLTIAIDHTPDLTFTFVDQDFIDADTGFAIVGRNSIEAWVAVINAKVPGITASVSGGRIALTSNAGPTANASVEIVGGSLVSFHFFSVALAEGANRDYTIDRATGQIHLEQILAAGDRLSVGSSNTRAFLESLVIGTTTLADSKLWFNVDGSAQVIANGVTRSTQFAVTVLAVHDWGHTLKVQAVAGTPFVNVLPGDYVVLWDAALDATLTGMFRIVDATSSYFVIERRLAQTMRAGHRSVALDPIGANISKVFTCGGATRTTPTLINGPRGVTNTCEIFDPNTKLVTAVAPMAKARAFHTATKIANGKVVVVGGYDDNGVALTSIEIYNPATDTWVTSTQSLVSGAGYHCATLMASNKVLISGGFNGAISLVKTYEYDAATDTLTAVGDLAAGRYAHRAILLPNSNIFAVGGISAGVATATTEIYSPGGSTWAPGDAMSAPRSFFALQQIGTGAFTTVLAAGDSQAGAENDTAEIYTIATDTWAAPSTLPSSQLFEQKDGIWLQSGDIALLHSYAAPAVEAALKYSGGFSVIAANSLFTECATKFETQYVLLYKADASYLNHVVAIGGLEQLALNHYEPSATYEEWNGNTNTWTVPEPALETALTIADAGIAFVRTTGILQQLSVPGAANYTASSLVTLFNDQLRGATARTYHTNQMRVATNSHALGGDIALVTQDDAALNIKLTAGSAVENKTGHIGSIETGNSQLGTPTFLDMRVVGKSTVPNAQTAEALILSSPDVESQHTIVALRNWHGGPNGGAALSPAGFYKRYDSNFGFWTSLAAATSSTSLTKADARVAGLQTWVPGDRVYAASPYAIAPSDDLKVLVDNDTDKRFNISLFRKLDTVGNTYSLSNVLRDADANASLAVTFGLTFDFNDFVAYMSARAIAYDGDANRKVLIRYLRQGPDGDDVRVRFANPDAPDSALVVDADIDSQSTADVRIKLQGGAARTLSVRSSTKLGVSCTSETGGVGTFAIVLNLKIASAARVTNVTTLTLTLPAGVTDHGLMIGNSVYVESTDPNFSTGLKTLTAVTATTVVYAEVDVDNAGVNIGTVTYDTVGEATAAGSGILVGDFARIVDVDNSFPADFRNNTFVVASIGAGTGHFTVTSGEKTNNVVNTILSWNAIDLDTDLEVFANPAQTMSTIVTAVNALANATDSKCPIKLTLLSGGTGVVDRSTPESQGDSTLWYVLADGVNCIAKTTPPLNVSGNYTLQFKNPITGTLATGADWVNEDVWICPSTAKNMVDWLNAPTVSGLFSVCTIEESSDGTKVQIASKKAGSNGGVQVQGGRGNSLTASIVGGPRFASGGPSRSISTVKKSDAEGLRSGMWCEITNASGVPKPFSFTASTALVSWAVDGTVDLSSITYSELAAPIDSKLQWERQGRYIAISDTGLNPGLDLSSVVPGSFVRVTVAATPTAFAQVSSANQGIYRILRVSDVADYGGGTIWIENTGAIEEVAECNVAVYDPSSVMPGDQFIVSTPEFGVQNQGTWVVEKVGTTTPSGSDQFSVNTRFKVSTVDRSPIAHGSSPALGSDYRLLQMVEGTPCKHVKRIDGVYPNQDDGSFVDIRWDSTIFASTIAAAAGSIVTVMDKLAFPLDVSVGIDGYAYDTGLIGEANRVIQGDSSDTTTYPGVGAAGAQLYVSGPVVKRITLALNLRIRSSVSNSDVAGRVRSAVATVVNQTGIGQPIALSKIVAAASKVVGVVAVTVVSPSYTVGSDLIVTQPNEKPLVLNLDQDIQISFTGE